LKNNLTTLNSNLTEYYNRYKKKLPDFAGLLISVLKGGTK